MLNPDKSCFENNVDPDQKPVDCHSASKYMIITGVLQVKWIKIEHKHLQMRFLSLHDYFRIQN